MTAVVAAAVAGLAFGALSIAIRQGIDRAGDARAGAVVIIGGATLVTAVASVGRFHAVAGQTVIPLLCAGALAPGVTQGLFARAIDAVGASRATILANTAPLFSALFATTLLGERLTMGLAVGTVAIVLGAGLLAAARPLRIPSRPRTFPTGGVALATACAICFATRDNVVRYALRGASVGRESVPLTLGAATLVAALYVAVGGGPRSLWPRLRRTAVAFAPAALLLALAFESLVTALAHGRVVVVAPLVATQSLWAVALSSLLLDRDREGMGPRVLVSAALIALGGSLIGVFR